MEIKTSALRQLLLFPTACGIAIEMNRISRRKFLMGVSATAAAVAAGMVVPSQTKQTIVSIGIDCGRTDDKCAMAHFYIGRKGDFVYGSPWSEIADIEDFGFAPSADVPPVLLTRVRQL